MSRRLPRGFPLLVATTLSTLASLAVLLLPLGLAARSVAGGTHTRRLAGSFVAAWPMRSGRMHRSLGIVHTFAGLTLDRSRTAELKDQAAFEEALRAPASKFVVFHGTAALVSTPPSSAAPCIAYQTRANLEAKLAVSVEQLAPRRAKDAAGEASSPSQPQLTCVALGAGEHGGWVFAVDVSSRNKEETIAAAAAAAAAPLAAEGAGAAATAFEPVRGLLATMGGAEVAVCGQGAAILAWHRQNQYCGVCGSPMVSVEAGGRRACTSCRNKAYPRIDPVCIALVMDPQTDSVLLGRQTVYRPGMYSCLAGYVEQCESLEESIRREIKEEAGVDVGRIVYHSSQPWPIGRGSSCQLMMGYICVATSTTITIDRNELEDARWFSRAEVAAAKELVLTPQAEDDPSALSIPGPYAIAHHLIRHWIENMPPRHRL